MSDTLDIEKRISQAKKNIQIVTPGEVATRVAPVIKVGGYAGNKFKFKFKPLNILEIVSNRKMYPELSVPQKDSLVDMWGLDPEIWPVDWTEAIFEVGMRGGKNTVVVGSLDYVSRLIVSLENPYDYLSYYTKKNIPISQDIEITNNSMVGEGQARVFFKELKKIFKNSVDQDGENIYRKYLNMNVSDEGKGDIKKRVIETPTFFKDSGRILYHSLDSGVSSFEGKNILIALIDEPSRANTEILFNNAEALYSGLLSNVDGSYPEGVGKAIPFSYPNTSEYDLIHKLVTTELDKRDRAREKGIEYKSNKKVFIYSTFQFNPTKKKTDPVIAERYEKNPEDAMARYECIKSKSQFAFFKPHLEKIDQCVIRDMQNRINYMKDSVTRQFKDGSSKIYTANKIIDIRGDDKFRVWSLDTSINKDRFVIGCGYNEQLETDYNSLPGDNLQVMMNKRIICDTIIVWEPTKMHPVDYKNVGEIIELLLDAFPNTVKATGDDFQMENITGIFEQRGIEMVKRKFTNAIQFRFYTLLRTAIYNGLIGYINFALLVEELKRVQKSPTGDKIDHPRTFSKDVADMLVQLYYVLSDLRFSDMTEAGGIDRYRDAKLIEMVNRYIIFGNEARSKNIAQIDSYICERMSITMKDLIKIKEYNETFFPQVN